ncbi:uncharacterized protein LAESUDRAFT_697386 [Laetiporus sulphureus 93-53]|uniref:Zn(2)-C6 fungal-type domain-containing protein n=1 Tax=Laetiporus sulphureus 93-53 TaxID=1314785 RepID=A0A165F5S7_9APHY|nr:uncharacterized protein LAESUDRAFT_697386 [Laetiporus sulphureus 93-53]KZT08444.1 hypothetical protein LAESUDRAFT_697386 [Laetiporus sulphureus 93-53]
MEEFHIVFEAPQDGQTRKKRARLVTSCDHCRLKKIKCVQSRNSSKCAACAAARVACKYHDREQYFAERGRIMSRNSPPSCRQKISMCGNDPQISITVMDTYHDPQSSSSSDASSPSSSVTDCSPSPTSAYSSLEPFIHTEPFEDSITLSPPPLWQSPCDIPSPIYSPNKTPFNVGTCSYGIIPEPLPSIQQSSYLLPLFDPQWPDRPHQTLMMHFIQTYFDHYGQSFPCLAYDETVRLFLEQTLSPLIATGIAALAAWYSDVPEVVRRGAADVCAAYCSHAKALVSRMEHLHSVETVHGLILVAWAEYKRARMSEFCAHVKQAKRISEEIGLANGTLIQLASSDYEESILRNTWGVLRQLVTTVDTWTA